MRKLLKQIVMLLEERKSYLPGDFASLFLNTQVERLVKESNAELEKPQKVWLIWNFERGMWWKAGQHGYTPRLKEAGTYTFEEALRLVEGANKFCHKDKPEEALLPVYGNKLG